MSETFTGVSPPFLIRIFTQIATGLHYLESVGVMFVLWLCPSLTPEPRIHQFITASPVPHHHYHHHHHHHHRGSNRSKLSGENTSHSDPTSGMTSEGDPALEDSLERVDQALREEQEREKEDSDSMPQILRWREGQRIVDVETEV